MTTDTPTMEVLQEEMTELRQRLSMLEGQLKERTTECSLFRAIIDDAPDAIAIAGPEGRLTYVNAAFQALYGYGAEIIGQPLADLWPEAATAQQPMMPGPPGNSRTWQHIGMVRRKDGRLFPAQVSLFSVSADDMPPYSLVSIHRDISSIPTAATLHESPPVLQHFLDHSPDVMSIYDMQQRYLLTNHTHAALLGLRREDVIGKTAADLFAPETVAAWQQLDRQVLETGQPVELEEIISYPDGLHTFMSIKFPLSTARGVPYAIGTISHDITARKQTETALRTFFILAEHSPDAIAVSDLDGVVVYSNASMNELLGLESLIGLTTDRIVAPEEQGKLPHIYQSIHTDGLWRGPVSYQRTDGTGVPTEVSAFLIRSLDGVAAGIATIIRDITDQQRLEAALEGALHESQSLLHGMLNYSSAIIYVKDLDERFLLINQRFAVISGYERGRIIGEYQAAIFPPEITDTWRNHDQQVLKTSQTIEVEEMFPHPDGLHTYLSVKFPIYDQQGKIYAIGGISTDITERKRAEQSLAEAYARLTELNEDLSRSRDVLHAIFNCLDDGLLLLNREGCIMAINEALATLLGNIRPVEELINCRWETLCGSVDPPFPGGLALRTLRDGRGRRRRERAINTNGQVRILDMQTFPLTNPAHSTDQVVMHIVDITERLQLETLVIENERFAANGRLAATVAHEVNTPLQAIQNLLYLVGRSNETQRNIYLRMMRDEIERISTIVRQLLDLYRSETSTVADVNLNALIERVLLLISGTLAKHRIGVEHDLAPDIPPLQGRADQLTQVLINLIMNAVDAMPDGGTLYVWTWQGLQPRKHRNRYGKPGRKKDSACPPHLPGRTGPASSQEMVIIEIVDTGIGISPDLQSRIFEPFFTTKPEGTGLGLAISQKIIQQHNGQISVASSPGNGSAFTIVLPLKNEFTTDATNAED